MRHNLLFAVLASLATTAPGCAGGCGSDGGAMGTDTDDDSGGTADGVLTTDGTTGELDDESGDETSGGPELPPPPTSSKANVKQKGPKQLRNDFAQALSLPPDTLCDELGGLSCTDEVHTVTLGGVEPDELGIYSPAKTSSTTTPIAVERVALAACGRRVDADLAGERLIFDLSLTGGALDDIDSPEVSSALTVLYQRALVRDPTEAELEHLRDLYPLVVTTGSSHPARDWAVGSCFAVLTTLESIFY